MDGTLAETERDGHRVAFNLAFEACGLPWHWDAADYGPLLRVTGGRERLLYDMSTRGDAPTLPAERAALALTLHERKNIFYTELVHSGAIGLRDGVLGVLQQCRERDRPMGITTTTSRSNVDALLAANLGSRWRDWFQAVLCGEDVRHKKPAPDVFESALAELGIDAHDALAIEDSPAGVAAACAARVPVIVTRSAYFTADTFEGAIAVGAGLHERQSWTPAPFAAEPGQPLGLDDIDAWWLLAR